MKKFSIVFASLLVLSLTGTSQATDIKFQHMWPDTHKLQPMFETAIKDAVAKSNNELNIEYFTFANVTTPLKVNEGLKEGQIDIAVMVPSTTMMELPLTSTLGIPFLTSDNSVASATLADIYAGSEAMQKEMSKDFHVLTLWASGRSVLASKTKVVKKPEDLKDLKIVVSGPLLAQDVKAWGAVPVVVPYTDEYNTMKSDDADVYYNSLFHAVGHNIQDFSKQVTMLTPAVTPFFIAVRNETWDKLSKVEQDALTSVFSRDFGIEVGTKWYEMGEDQLDAMKKANATIHNLTAEEFKAFADKVVPPAQAFWKGILMKAGLTAEAAESWLASLYKNN